MAAPNSGARGGWLSRAGPDQRGYGGSSRPEAVEAYDIRELTTDIVGLLDDVGAERAVWVVMTGRPGGMGCGAAASRSRRRWSVERAAVPRSPVPPPRRCASSSATSSSTCCISRSRGRRRRVGADRARRFAE
ncbi:alpha/beta hydrolase family protein [Mycobacterium xenopi 3993]|nr:alpha/beta hydrolase family protein [Mycobacterium xenopi 3993]